jgi:uncharacterized protein YdhG (YjbR/CyaY superfamily)
MAAKPNDVNGYIATAPPSSRPLLRSLRAIIRSAAPQALEKISYGMPYYALHGRLAYFRLAKAHLGLYIPTPVLADHARDLKGYDAAGATIRFPLTRKLPAALIRKLVRARAARNSTARASR